MNRNNELNSLLAGLKEPQRRVWVVLRGETPMWVPVSHVAESMGMSRQAVSGYLRDLCGNGFAKNRIYKNKTKLYRATLPTIGNTEPLPSDEDYKKRIQDKMLKKQDVKLAKIWQDSFKSAFNDNQRPDLLFDVTSIFHPAFCADSDFHITGWSKSFEDLFGIPNGVDLFIFFRRFNMRVYDPKIDKEIEGIHAVDEMRKQLADNGSVRQLPVILRINGLYEFIEISCVIQKPYNGIQGIMPISKSMRVMRTLRDQEQLFSTSLAHDFNSPLAGLSTKLQLLLYLDENKIEDPPLSEDIKIQLCEMLDTVRSLKTSLSLYRQYTNNNGLTVFDPVFVINRFLPLAKMLAPRVEFDDSEHELRDDYGLYLADGTAFWFQRALQNMIKNSIEAIHHRYGENVYAGKIAIKTKRYGNNSISISIIDNGCGIPEEKLRKLNDIGYSSKSGSDHQGLGLSIVRQVAKMAGNNEPKFYSQEKNGTTVELILSVERNISDA